MERIEVSVIILNYKQEHFLFELINYLTCYSFKIGIEFIIVDNNSIDEKNKNCLAEKASLSGFPFTFLFFDQNFGPSYARNRAVDSAKGTYIQLIDADDWILPQKIELQYQFALKYGSPSFIASRWATVEYTSAPNNYLIIEEKEPEFIAPEILSVIRPDGFTPLMSGLIKKEDYVKVGGLNEEMWLIEDVNFQIRLILEGASFMICPYDQSLFFYRKGQNNSLSQSNDYMFNKNSFNNALMVQNSLLSTKKSLISSELRVFSDIYSNALFKSVAYKDLKWKNDIIDAAKRLGIKFRINGGRIKKLLFNVLGPVKYFKMIIIYHKIKAKG